jgi:two-component system, cell cycle response regulator
MALRVLLADESATIKKVMQISLQDFAVEVRSVQVGLDVLQAAQQFKPDIIFADILLQKKNGYEVSQELKKQPATKSIPIVLMWSGFMEIDHAKLKSSLADSQLEKPFDSDTLRSLIHKLVPKTKTQDIGKYLDFPETPKIEATQTKTSARPPSVPSISKQEDITEELQLDRTVAMGTETVKRSPKTTVEVIPNSNEPSWSMDSFDDLADYSKSETSEEFQQVPISSMKSKSRITDPEEESEGLDLSKFSSESEDEWVQKDISAFKVDLPQDEDEPALEFDVPEDDLDAIMNTQTKPMARVQQEKSSPKQTSRPESARPSATVVQTLSQADIEKIVREQSQEIIEKVVKKLVPDLASQLIKDEIRRLLDETS